MEELDLDYLWILQPEQKTSISDFPSDNIQDRTGAQ